MSVVVGIETHNGVWLGADSSFSTDTESTRLAGKIFKLDNGLAFGFVGNINSMQAIKYSLDIDVPKFKVSTTDEEILEWLVTQLIPTLKQLCETYQVWEWTKKSERGLSCLVVVGGRLFTIQEDWAVWRSLEGYAAIGSGSSVSLGSLFSSAEYSADYRCSLAVQAASHHVPTCAGPVHAFFVKR